MRPIYGRASIFWRPKSAIAKLSRSSWSATIPLLDAADWFVCLLTSRSLDMTFKFNRCIPNVAKTEKHILTVAHIMTADIATPYAWRSPYSTAVEEVKAWRLRAPDSMTACGEIASAYLGTSLISLPTNMFSPIDMPIALLVISTDLNKSSPFLLPSCQCGKGSNSCRRLKGQRHFYREWAF